jgi:hypothetical protein
MNPRQRGWLYHASLRFASFSMSNPTVFRFDAFIPKIKNQKVWNYSGNIGINNEEVEIVKRGHYAAKQSSLFFVRITSVKSTLPRQVLGVF